MKKEIQKNLYSSFINENNDDIITYDSVNNSRTEFLNINKSNLFLIKSRTL